MFQFKWYFLTVIGCTSRLNTWQVLEDVYSGVVESAGEIYRFYHKHPDKPQHGELDISDTLMSLKDAEHIIYGQWLLETSPNNMFKKPPVTDLLRILDLGDLYCKRLDEDDEYYERQLALIKAVDNPPEAFGLATRGWEEEMNDRGGKRHLSTKSDMTISQVRLQCLQMALPALRAELEKVPVEQRHLPVPYAWSEVGITDMPKLRRNQHADHSATTCILSFIECVAVAEFGGKYRFIYAPITRYRTRKQGPMMESFFSRACKSYAWLGGGVNVKEAGTSTKSADNLIYEEIETNLKTMDLEEMDRNLDLAEERLGAFKFVIGEEKRQDIKAGLKAAEDERKRLEKEERLEFFEGAQKLRQEVLRMKEHTEREILLAKAGELISRILELEEEKHKMRTF